MEQFAEKKLTDLAIYFGSDYECSNVNLSKNDFEYSWILSWNKLYGLSCHIKM